MWKRHKKKENWTKGFVTTIVQIKTGEDAKQNDHLLSSYEVLYRQAGAVEQTKFSAEFSMKILCRKRMQLLSSKIINIWLTSQVHWRSLLNLDWDEILRHISTFTRNKQTHSNTVIKVNSQLPTLIICMVYNSIFGLLLKKTNQTDLCHWKLQIPLSPKDELGPGTSHHGITYL